MRGRRRGGRPCRGGRADGGAYPTRGARGADRRLRYRGGATMIPTRSRVAAVLAAMACAVGCTLPFLVAAGVLTGAAAAALRSTLLAATAALATAALAMWWLHRRRSAAPAGP